MKVMVEKDCKDRRGVKILAGSCLQKVRQKGNYFIGQWSSMYGTYCVEVKTKYCTILKDEPKTKIGFVLQDNYGEFLIHRERVTHTGHHDLIDWTTNIHLASVFSYGTLPKPVQTYLKLHKITTIQLDAKMTATVELT